MKLHYASQIARLIGGAWFMGHGLWTGNYSQMVIGALCFDMIAVVQNVFGARAAQETKP